MTAAARPHRCGRATVVSDRLPWVACATPVDRRAGPAFVRPSVNMSVGLYGAPPLAGDCPGPTPAPRPRQRRGMLGQGRPEEPQFLFC